MADFDGTRKSDGKAKPASQPADAAATVAAGSHAADVDLAHRKTLPVGATQAGLEAEAEGSVRPLVSTRIDSQNSSSAGQAEGASTRARQATRGPHEPAFADTHRDVRQEERHNPRLGRNPKLGRTLRMELKLGGMPTSPELDAPAAASNRPELGRSQSRLGGGEAFDPRDGKSLQLSPMRHVGINAPVEHSSARNVLTSTTPMAPQTATFEPRDPFTRDVFTRTNGGSSAAPRNSVSRSESTRTTDRHLLSQLGLGGRRKAPRVADRTMILSQRRSHVKDWLFVVALVAALGVTASMLLSYQSETAELSEQVEEQEAATNGLEPENAPVAPAPRAATAATTTATAATTTASAATAAPVRATELRSQPAGAEVAVQGAVVGNTPVRVARSDRDIDYTLRFPGYEPQVVRVGAQSPAAIAVTLRQSASAPATDPTSARH